MSSTEVVISKGASTDISALAKGKARADVALGALKEEDLTPAQIKVLTALARKFEEKVSSGLVEGSSNSPTESQEITLKGSPAIEIYVQVNGQTVRAVLSDASFNKSRTVQNSYAEELGGRLATREENIAVANALLEKEQQGTLNPAEAKLLKTYRDKWVRDSQGGLAVDGRRVSDSDSLLAFDNPHNGALVVLPLAESK